MYKYEFVFMFRDESGYRTPYEELAQLWADSDTDAVIKFFDILGKNLCDSLEYMTFRRLNIGGHADGDQK